MGGELRLRNVTVRRMPVHRLPEMPEVSVLMTVFNTEAYLAEAIESVLGQRTGRPWELIIVDDGSSDGSLRIAQQYRDRYPDRICVLQHPRGQNRGISTSRNLALRHARGELTAFLDSDDVWLPHHLETQAALLRRLPHVAMVYAGAERWVDASQPFDEQRARQGWWGGNYLPPLVPTGRRAGLLERGELLQWFLEDDSKVPCICTVLVRTAVAREAGGFCDEFRGLYDDQVFHATLSMEHGVYAHDVCVARYRQHDRSCCAVAERDGDTCTVERERFLRLLQERDYLTPARVVAEPMSTVCG